MRVKNWKSPQCVSCFVCWCKDLNNPSFLWLEYMVSMKSIPSSQCKLTMNGKQNTCYHEIEKEFIVHDLVNITSHDFLASSISTYIYVLSYWTQYISISDLFTSYTQLLLLLLLACDSERIWLKIIVNDLK